jgi:hypothetical protein
VLKSSIALNTVLCAGSEMMMSLEETVLLFTISAGILYSWEAAGTEEGLGL